MIALGGHWFAADHCDARGVDLYLRHYSSAKGKRDRRALLRHGFVGVGEKLVLVAPDGRAVFAWLRPRWPRMDGQVGVNCTIFRNEGPILSSVLVAEADELAWARWPGERHFTYVDPAKTSHRRSRRNPAGHCFVEAGWRPCGLSPDGKVILERLAALAPVDRVGRRLESLGGEAVQVAV